jgi:hypothetical protein
MNVNYTKLEIVNYTCSEWNIMQILLYFKEAWLGPHPWELPYDMLDVTLHSIFNCLLDYDYVLHIVNFTILYVLKLLWDCKSPRDCTAQTLHVSTCISVLA